MLGAFWPYLRFVCSTSTWAHPPADHLGTVKRNQPVIVALWHGQTMLLPESSDLRSDRRAPSWRTRWSPSRLRGLCSDGHWSHSRRRPKLEGKGSTRCKGASSGYQVSRWRGERRDDGRPVDVLSQVWSRHCEAGAPLWSTNCAYGYCLVPLLLAAHTKSIYDQSRLALVVGKPMFISRDDETEGLEHCRQRVENALNEVTYKAYAAARANAAIEQHRG
jgi:hypothetical protein